jgi:hypothetical protein
VNFALDYLNEEDVKCRVDNETDGSGDPLYRPITFLSTNLLQVGGAPAGVGLRVVFERTVAKDSLLVDYHNGDQIDEDNLSIMQKQALMAMQEIADGRFNAFSADLNMGGFKIVDSGYPSEPTDVATKAYVDSHVGPAGVEEALAAAAVATAQATLAGTHETTTLGYKNAAAGSATAAAGSEAAAAASAASLVGIIGMSPPGGRLTLTSGTAFPIADVAMASVIYYTPALSEWIRVFNGTADDLTLFSELSLQLDNVSTDTGYHQAGKQFDLFVFKSSGTKLGTGPAWASDNSRGTGAGTTEIEFFKGHWRNKNAITLRYGSATGNTVSIPARQATFVGSFRATFDGVATDTILRRLLSNAYNPTPRFLFANAETLGTTWNYTILTWRQVNANPLNKIELLQCLSGGPLESTAISSAAHSIGNATKYVGIGVNSITTNSGKDGLIATTGAGLLAQGFSNYAAPAQLGYTYLAWLEISAASGTTSWYAGDVAAASVFSNGIRGKIWN